MSRLTHSLLVALLTAPLMAQQEVHGELSGDTTWRGHIVVTGDVVVPQDSVLTVARGARVEIAQKDATSGGWDPALVEIRVEGLLQVDGSASDLICFGPANPESIRVPEDRYPVTWHGISLLGEAPDARSRISGMYMFGAHHGIQVPSGSPEIVDSLFVGCGAGVGAGAAYKDRTGLAVRGDGASPQIERCRFVRCFTGVYAEWHGAPEVRASIFRRCAFGMGNDRLGTRYPMNPPGMVAVGCLFTENGDGVQGVTFARDSIWIGNRTAISFTTYHYLFVTNIEHTAAVSSLFWDNEKLVRGEFGIGTDGVHEDPRFAMPLSVLDEVGPPIPDEFGFEDGSPALGAASDGGDLGPRGRRHGSGHAPKPPLEGTVPASLWVARADGKSKLPRRAGAPAPGEKMLGTWWAPVETHAGWLDLKRTFGIEEPAGAIAATWNAAAEGEIVVRIDGDLEKGFDVTWNGKPVRCDDGRRRSGEPIELTVEADEGANLLMLSVEGFGAVPHVAISIEGEGEFDDPASAGELDGESIRGAKLSTSSRKPPEIVLTLGADAHWGDDGQTGLVEIVDDGGRMLVGCDAIVARVTHVRRVVLEQVPETAQPGMTLRLTGLRRADGTELGGAIAIE